jgi:hypothetical protein
MTVELALISMVSCRVDCSHRSGQLAIRVLADDGRELRHAPWLAIRTSTLMRHTNELPIFTEMSQELRSRDFQRDETYVLQGLAGDHSPDLGISRLPEDAKAAVTSVLLYFNNLGAYVAFGLIDENIVVSMFAYRANRAWVSLEPYILEERRFRNDDYHVSYFEDLVCRIRDNWSPRPHIKYSHKTHRLDDEGKKWRLNSVLIDKRSDPARERWRSRWLKELRNLTGGRRERSEISGNSDTEMP